ncbi:MAG TPA: hypothetical protein VKX17_04395 [Planctomycetota bacterium]|nr:hypothetical protein [Planctomycetota bacterium]
MRHPLIHSALLTTAFWQALAVALPHPANAHTEGAAPRTVVQSTGTLEYQEAKTQFVLYNGPNTVSDIVVYQKCTYKVTLDVTSLPQPADAKPTSLTILTDSVLSFTSSTKGSLFSVAVSEDPNVSSDIDNKGEILIKRAAFADDAYFPAMQKPPKGWSTGDPTTTVTIKLGGPHGMRATELIITIEAFRRYALFNNGDSTVATGDLLLYGTSAQLAPANITSAPLLDTITVSFGDTAPGSVTAKIDCAGVAGQTYKPAKAETGKLQRSVNEKAKLIGKS